VSDQVDVLVQSYDDPPARPFDLVLAIESLAHSGAPERSLAALVRRLAPGGLLVVVDDMPEPGAEGSADLARFKAGWQCPVLWSVARYEEALHTLGLRAELEDLTAELRPRELAAIERLERWNTAAQAVVPLVAWRATLASYAGGLALERLYRRGLMRYGLIAATKA
jgi:SAM-dependent methyltransferase